MRIVFLGDSLTEGRLGAGYVAKVAEALPHVECLNAGKGGSTALNVLRRLPTDLARYSPDGAVIMVGVNDAIAASQGWAWRVFYRVVKGVPGGRVSLHDFCHYYQRILQHLLERVPHVWAVLPPVEHNPALAAALRQFNAEAARIAAGEGVPVLDLMAALVPSHIPSRRRLSGLSLARDMIRYVVLGADYNADGERRGYTYTLDGVHLADHGAERVAAEIVALLRAEGV